MKTLESLIKQIDGWNLKSAQDVLNILQIKNIQYEDKTDWTWKGIAGVVNKDTGERLGRDGCKRLQDALLAAGEQLWVSQISAGMPLNDPEIQGVLRYLDQTGAVPGARFIADAVLRQISVLEQNNIVTTLEEVTQVLTLMKLDLYKQSKIDAKQDQLQAYREAMTIWNGTDPEPEF